MASNNRKAPQRCPPKSADDRNRHAASRAPQTAGSLHAKRRIDNKKIQETLEDMFVNIFDSEIIRSVAHSCGWDLNKSVEALIMLAEDNEFPETRVYKNENTNCFQSPSTSVNDTCENASFVPKSEQPITGRRDEEKENEPFSESLDTSVNQSHATSTHTAKKMNMMTNASQGSIKVAYRSQDDNPEDDDDDADVVIEEEKEFEANELDLTYTGVSMQSLYQFLSPVQSSDQLKLSNASNVGQNSVAGMSKVNFQSPNKDLLVKSKETFPNSCLKVFDEPPQKASIKKHCHKLERIKKQIASGIKVMVLLRGCPGSGKTSLGRLIIKSTHGKNEQNYIFSTDDYFTYIGKGKYMFDPKLLPSAHQWNQQRVGEEVKKRTNPIIIDNTNLEAWEMEPYIRMAVAFGYSIELLEPRTSWKYNSYELERKNTHNVSRRKIDNMLGRFDRDLSPTKLLSLFHLKYSPYNTPPQYTTPWKPSITPSQDSPMSGARKKLNFKEEEMSVNKSSASRIHPANQVKFLGTDETDGEIKKSLDVLWSEWKHSFLPMQSEKLKNISSESNDNGKEETKIVNGENSIKNTEGCLNIGSQNSKGSCSNHEIIEGGIFAGVIAGDDKIDQMTNEVSEGKSCISHAVEKSQEENKNNILQCIDSTFDAEKDNNRAGSKCSDYVMVLSDGTLVPQKSYTESDCNSYPSQQNGREWEYLLMTDGSNLQFYPVNGNNSLNIDIEDTKEFDGDIPDCKVTPLKPTKTLSNLIQEKELNTECSPVQKLIAENSSLESVFLAKGIKDMKCVGTQDTEIETKLTQGKSDLLIVDDGLVLNIAFTGVNDSASFVPQNLDYKNDNNTKAQSDEEKLLLALTPAYETTNISVETENSVQNIMLQNMPNAITYKNTEIEEAVKQSIGVNPVNTSVPEIGHLVQVDNMESGPKLISEKERESTKCLSSVKSCSARQNSFNDNILTYSDDLNMNRTSEKDLLESWAEGTCWDEETVVKSVISSSQTSSSPKPARNEKPEGSVRCSMERSNEKGSKCDVNDISEQWSTVDEPMETWEMKSELVVDCSRDLIKEVVPQPQRKASVGPNEVKNNVGEVKNMDHDKYLKLDNGAKEIFEKPVDIYNTSSDRLKTDLVTWFESGDAFVEEAGASSNLHLVNSSSPTPFKVLEHMTHSSTNTHHTDFIVLSNINVGDPFVPGVKVLLTQSRNIMEGDDSDKDSRDIKKMRPVLMLDKSSMTYDIISSAAESENIKEQLDELVNIFPQCQIEDLQEIYERCNKDINWTVDLLLESANQGIEISSPNRVLEVNSESSLTENSQVKNEEHVDCTGGTKFEKSDCEIIVDSLPSSASQMSSKPSLPSKRSGKKDRTPVSETSLLLKKQLEENIVIDSRHYSEHVSWIRKLRHGDVTETFGSIQELDDCSDVNTILGNVIDSGLQEQLPEKIGDSTVSANHSLSPNAPEWVSNEIDLKDLSEEEEETVYLNVEPSFAEQLHSIFGTACLALNQDVKPTLCLPLSLARQLHSYMMEAEQNTYDLIMQEDEDFARKLQLQEDRISAEVVEFNDSPVPDLREIMDMEMALALYKTNQKRSNPDSKEDMATKLTKDLLCEWFPSVPKDMLVNVFEAHNHSFEETLEVLLASTEEDNSVRVVMSPEALAAHEKTLLQKASMEGVKNKENMRPSPLEKEEVTQEQALLDADYYRSEATRHYKLRNECQLKAQKAYQRGLTAVASYYSQMASLHKEKIEDNNARAASSLLLAHSLGNLSTTLDLHFLYVVEALQVLDMFLDHHIHHLLESSQRSVPVFVITGRGLRSSGGRSRIKPAVVQRLEQRGLRHEEVNPGLLKVVITRSAASVANTNI